VTRIRYVGSRLAALVLITCTVTGCAGREPVGEVRPLVDLEGVQLTVGKYDDESLKERLERLVAETGPVAKAAGGWGKLTTDLLNPEVMDIVFVGTGRATLNFGYGTEATSVLSRDDHTIFAMAGDTGSCWAIRVSGRFDEPDVLYGNTFAPNCSADKLADHTSSSCPSLDACVPPKDATGAESLWFSQWPPTASPTATGPEGLEIGEAPQDAAGQ